MMCDEISKTITLIPICERQGNEFTSMCLVIYFFLFASKFVDNLIN
jgi:hypothetical protein